MASLTDSTVGSGGKPLGPVSTGDCNLTVLSKSNDSRALLLMIEIRGPHRHRETLVSMHNHLHLDKGNIA